MLSYPTVSEPALGNRTCMMKLLRDQLFNRSDMPEDRIYNVS